MLKNKYTEIMDVSYLFFVTHIMSYSYFQVDVVCCLKLIFITNLMVYSFESADSSITIANVLLSNSSTNS